jgi:anti-sigma factor RsiW
MNDEKLSELVKKHATRHQVSDSVRASIRTHVALQEAARSQSNVAQNVGPVVAPTATTIGGISWWKNLWPKASLGFAFGVALTLLMSWWIPRLLIEHSIPSELVAGYVKALRVGPLIEVASSDKHTVKPWFLGKLDFAPPVHDLVAQGFALLGARVEKVRGVQTAVLSYAKDKHIISVYIWPSSDVEISQAMRRNGFNVRQWNQTDMQLWAVSDVDANELARFVEVWQSTEGYQPPASSHSSNKPKF